MYTNKKKQIYKKFNINEFINENCLNPTFNDFFEDVDYEDDYEVVFDYASKNSNYFYKYINNLKHIFKEYSLLKIKENKTAVIDCNEVYLDLNIEDFKEGINSVLLRDIFLEGNKNNLDVSVSIKYKDFNFEKIEKISIIIENPFLDLNKQYKELKNSYIFNPEFNKNISRNEHKLDFIKKRMQKFLIIPNWCETFEDRLLFYFINQLNLSKDVINIFGIENLIKDKEILKIFKTYII